MSDLRSNLQRVFNELKGVEERARGLKNQNLADIATSARAKVQQLSEHADLDLVDDRKDQAHPGNPVYVAPATKEEAIARMRADGDADPESTARMNWPHLFDAPPFPGAAPADDDDQKTFHPGDPKFSQQNPNFRDPGNVELNKDGTLQRAPNSLGTAPDVR